MDNINRNTEDKKSGSKGISKYINVNPISDDAWKVEIFIPSREMSASILPKILRIAKQKISSQHNLPLGLLTYEDLMQKKVRSDGVDVTAKIIRGKAEKGEPKLKFVSARSSRGIKYDDMELYLDLFPLRENGAALKADEVWKLLENIGLDNNKINAKTVNKAIEALQKNMVAIRNILVARGSFPEPGVDARVKFAVELEKEDEGDFISVSTVKANEIICRKIPPIKGSEPGITVRGDTLEPEEPLDIRLVAGEGTEISQDQCEIYAVEPGIPRIREEYSFVSAVKSVITISIESVDVFDGSETLKITSDKHIKITGGLKSGSQIISQRMVIVSGDIDEDTSIMTSGNIHVSGRIKGGIHTTESDISEEGEIYSTKLMAHGTLTTKNTATHSILMGDEVNSKELVGCKVTAGSKAMIEAVSADEHGLTTMIIAGRLSHLQDKIRENQNFIDLAKNNLKRIEDILGEEIMDEASTANISRILMLHAKDLTKYGVQMMPGEHKEALRSLIGSISPIRYLMEEKRVANRQFLEEIEKDDEGDPEIVIKSSVEAPVEIEIAGIESTIYPEDGAVSLKVKEGEIIKKSFKDNAGKDAQSD